MSELARKKCVPCEGGMPPLSSTEADRLLPELNDWTIFDGIRLEKSLRFKDFAAALAFINKVGEIAEEENHHPDFYLTGWNKVKFSLSTHAVGGLSMNDFILAAKIDELAS